MNMFRAFLDLDTIHESYNNYGDRQKLISKIKALGRCYYFDKYSNEQLFNIWKKESAKNAEQKALKDYYDSKFEKAICNECGCILTDGGYCPRCDDGVEDLEEDVFNSKPFNQNSWVSASGQPVNLTSNSKSTTSAVFDKYIVRIVNYRGRLRALATDGVHPAAWVAFPNSLRQFEGQMYEVDQLVWNGKNYRIVGNINPVKSAVTAQNINENIIKENYKMNFQTILEELNSLYEEETKKINEEELPAEEPTEAESLTEAAIEEADEEITVEDEPILDDEAEEPMVDEDVQVVLECANCGALVLKSNADIEVAEDGELVNSEEACQYCEENKGYKILGNLVPVENDAPLDEGIFNKNKNPGTIRGYKQGDNAFASKIANELSQQFGGEVRQVKTSAGNADVWVDTTNKMYKKADSYINKKYPDDSFSYNEYDSLV